MSATLQLTAAAPGQASTTETQYVAVKCDCPGRRGQYLRHYDKVRCPDCGLMFWALQPKRGGPLVSKPWPGPNLTRAEMLQKGWNE